MVHIYIPISYFSLLLHIVAGAVTSTVLIKDPETIVSGNGNFKLGFFSPSNSINRYLGIWYDKVSVMDVIWLANRNNPLNDSSGVLRVFEDGNLQVLNGKKDVIWSTNVSEALPNTSRTTQLLDSGNFCLLELDTSMTSSSSTNGTVIWQTFDHPTDSVLPSMKVGMRSSNIKSALISWKSPSDPSFGMFSLGTDSLTHPQIIIWNGDHPHWRSGPWNGCMYWRRHLTDIQELPSDGVDIYIRLPKSELGNKNVSKSVIAGTIAIATCLVVIIVILCCLFWRCVARQNEQQVGMTMLILDNQERGGGRSQGHFEDLPQIKLENLVVATNNFHESNKLGKGGFGQVYKGRLEDGQEIAVKRLSATSGQGLQEFTNEVMLISRLQHRNLVRLIGFCAEGEEKMLVYEYMPNKSLDMFLFDPDKQKLLDWGKRFDIIEGICRGLIYLHRDSRLRIIHRDLKASNILLDEDLNPKISDFGTARIFMHNQDQFETRRVVGTYGYMSPEYAMEGHFSEKSDVYSFGVLVLEIVTGCRNNTFWIEEQSLSLLGYVWKLWDEKSLTSIIDPVISDSNFRMDIERCIQMGLLCVQEYVKDRPSIANVLSMLVSEIVEIPYPKQPGFNKRLTPLDTASSSSASGISNSITYLSAR